MADLFGRNEPTVDTPLTADFANINWGGIVTAALTVSVSAAQPVTKRRTIGNKSAVIFAGMSSGQINIARILTSDAKSLFSRPGWKACNPGTITLTADSCNGAGITIKCSGCVVSQYSIQLEAEGVTVVDNVVIDFLSASIV